jgi:ABC-type glycerol-3-phosphate transport system permease component
VAGEHRRRGRTCSGPEFVDGDISRWGSLMAGALCGSLPPVVLYAFFVEHYVAAMTGPSRSRPYLRDG